MKSLNKYNNFAILLLVLASVIFMTPTASAFLDNSEYDAETKTYTLTSWNIFGVPLDLVANITLLENTDKCMFCHAILNVTFDNKDITKEDFEWLLLDVNDGMKKTGVKKFKMQYLERTEEYEIPAVVGGKTVLCENEDILNLTLCEIREVVTTTETRENKIWTDFTEDTRLGRNAIIKISGTIRGTDTIDWFLDPFGKEAFRTNAWALWSGLDSLIAYFPLDVNGSNAHQNKSIILGNRSGVEFVSNTTALGNGSIMCHASQDSVIRNNERIEYFNASQCFGGGLNYTITAWLRAIDTTSPEDILIHWSKSDFQALAFNGIDGTFSNNLTFRSGQGVQFFIHNGTYTDTENWYLIAYTHTGSAGDDPTELWQGQFGAGMKSLGTNVDPLGCEMGDFSLCNVIGVASGFGSTAYIDEVGIWNRTLTEDELNELWNEGDGFAYPFADTIETTLTSPADNLNTLNQNVSFTCNATSIGTELSNITISLFKSSDNATIATGNKTVTGFSNGSIFSFVLPFDTYLWNCQSFGGIVSAWADDNRTLVVTPLIENSQTFDTNVLETDNSTFLLNISFNTSNFFNAEASLIYNGTTNIASGTVSGGDTIFNVTIDIPLVNLDEGSENKSFNWSVTLFNGTGSSEESTSIKTQNVSRVAFKNCTPGAINHSLNFTAYDESNLSQINSVNFDATFFYWLGGGSVFRSLSISDPKSAEKNYCIDPVDEIFLVNATIKYGESQNLTYDNRHYYFERRNITNSSERIFLFLLDVNKATTFILKVQDNEIIPIPNVFINILRLYPGEGIFKTVQIAKTDDNGKTVGFFETETVDYKFRLIRDEVILLETIEGKIFGEEVPFTLTFTVGEDLGKPWKLFEDLENLDFTLSFDRAGRIATFEYIDTSSDFILGDLRVEKTNLTFSTNLLICRENSTLSSATLACNIGDVNGSYLAKAFITRDEKFLVDQLNFVIQNITAILGGLGIILGFFIILVSAFVFLANEIAGIWSITTAVIFVDLMKLISFGPVFISAVILLALFFTILLRK